MKSLINFSHPLSTAALLRLEGMVGEKVQEWNIPVQLDLDAPLMPQLDALVNQGFGFDLYLPPALAIAAGYVMARLSYAQSDAMLPIPPAMVVLRREGTPPQFMPSEILR